MSGIERPSLFGHMPERGAGERRGERPGAAGEWRGPEHIDLTPEERRFAALTALKYALGIGMVFLVALILLVLFLLLIWGELG